MLTGQQLLTGLSRFIADEWDPAGLTSSADGTADGATLVDAAMSAYGTDSLRGLWVRIRSGGATNEISRVLHNQSVAGQLEFQPEFSVQIASGTQYEVHRYDPRAKMTALNEARIRAYPNLGRIIFDDTTTADGRTNKFVIPDTLEAGPGYVFEENWISVDALWNFLRNSLMTGTDGWTAVGPVTAETYSRVMDDLIVPKYQHTDTKITATGSGQYEQVVADMRAGTTADQFAGRQVTFAMWVYCLDPRVRLELVGDSGVLVQSDLHQGKGWELLHCTVNVARDNATTLTARVSFTDATVAHLEDGALYYGDSRRLTNRYPVENVYRVHLDNTMRDVELPWRPRRGRQLRFAGANLLTEIPTTFVTAMTTSLEVNENEAELLYAYAAQVLFEREILNAPDTSEVVQRMRATIARKNELGVNWNMSLPSRARIVGWWNG